MEAQAVRKLMALVEDGSIDLATSPALTAEIDASLYPERQAAVRDMMLNASVDLDAKTGSGDADFDWLRALGIKTADAFHILNARKGDAILVTTDDGILKKARKVEAKLGLRICSPVDAIAEVE